GAQAAADVHELDALEVAGRLVVVDDGVQGGLVSAGVPAGVRLAVHHDGNLARPPLKSVGRHEVDLQELDHGSVLGPAGDAVSGQGGRRGEGGFDQVGQAHHAGEAVRVGVNVGKEGDGGGISQPGEEAVGKPRFRGSTVEGYVSAATRHVVRPPTELEISP